MAITGHHWRLLTAFDLPAVEAIAARVHPGFFERPEVFAERMRLYPEGARILERNGKPAGYVLSHPWRHESVPELDSLLGTLPEDADTYYLHDVALLPETRGGGAAGMLVTRLADHARRAGLARMSLVAVNNSAGFWAKQGFVPADVPALAEKLSSYEAAAQFMVRELADR